MKTNLLLQYVTSFTSKEINTNLLLQYVTSFTSKEMFLQNYNFFFYNLTWSFGLSKQNYGTLLRTNEIRIR
jgi:hypothetical protein